MEACIAKRHDQKLKRILSEAVADRDTSILLILKTIIISEQVNGFVLNEVTKAYFRLKRRNVYDCSPLFELWDSKEYTVQESLLEVLGYDKVIPDIEEQKRIIDRYFDFGANIDNRYFCDPRYGLAAACAGWDLDVVQKFLEHCLTIPDAPLKYVAENSLKRKYIRFR